MQAEEEASGTSAGMVADLASSDDPRAISRTLRETPVMRIDDMFTLLTRREHVEDALRKSALFCWSEVPMDLGNIRPLIPLMIDPPQHVKYRRILDPLFAPKKMALLEDEVVALVKELVDEFAARGSCDLHEEFAVPLPCRVFLRLMGLPARGPRHLPGREGRHHPSARGSRWRSRPRPARRRARTSTPTSTPR